MLYLLGLGLNPSQTTEEVRAVLTRADVVYLDTYTNLFPKNYISEWESLAGKSFIKADRKTLEDGIPQILKESREGEVAVAVVGDPLTATTHVALYLEALKRDVPVRYLPGISIHTVAPSLSGLQHYKFGRTVTVPYHWKDSPSFYERIGENRRMGLHSLALLDLHPEPLTIPQALRALLHWEREMRRKVLELSDLVVGIARACFPDCFRYVGTVEELLEVKWGPPPHLLIIPSALHPVEEEVLYYIRRKNHGRCRGEV